MSQHINFLVYEYFSVPESRNDFDECILAWSRCKRHQHCLPIISLADAETLLTILYKHREGFLQALRYAYFPGLAALIFVLWRYIEFQRLLNDLSLSKERHDSFREMFWRSWLVAMHNQRLFKSLASEINEFCDLPDSGQGVVSIPTNFDDSLELIGAFIDRLTPPIDDTCFYDFLALVELTKCISFIRTHIVPGTGELMPPCFGALVERLWYTIYHGMETSARINEVLGVVINWFREMDELFQDTSLELLVQLMDKIIRTDFISLVGQRIFALNPSMDQSRHSSDRTNNAKFLRGLEDLFEKILKFVSAKDLLNRFESQEVDWWKVNDHLEFLALRALLANLYLDGASCHRCDFTIFVQEFGGPWERTFNSMSTAYHLRIPECVDTDDAQTRLFSEIL